MSAIHWHKRWHPLRETWVVYAGHRNNRPWTVSKQKAPDKKAHPHDSTCYLCAGNVRAGGHKNPDYTGIFIFDNDHPVLGLDAPVLEPGQGLYRSAPAWGKARVICYSPLHDETMAEMDLAKVIPIFKAWQDETKAIKAIAGMDNVLIFENKGEIVGVSNHHPHGQLYAGDFTFTLNKQYLEAAVRYHAAYGTYLFEDILENERKDGRRIIAENNQAIAFIPFFARYAYEVWVMPKKSHANLTSLSETELADLAEVYLTVLRKYDGLFNMSFPYVMSINQAPFHVGNSPHFRVHWQILPPLRQPDLRKFPAGPEIGVDTFMADTIPEEKAAELQAISVSL